MYCIIAHLLYLCLFIVYCFVFYSTVCFAAIKLIQKQRYCWITNELYMSEKVQICFVQ